MIRARLGITKPDDSAQLNAKLKASQHGRDYNVTGHFIRDLRRRRLDVEWRRADRDLDSVRIAVRSRSAGTWLPVCPRVMCGLPARACRLAISNGCRRALRKLYAVRS